MKRFGSNTKFLRALLKRAAHEYDARKNAAESKVVRRQYFSDSALNPRPFYFERFGFKPGRPLKHATPRCSEYGFARDGRLMVVREAAADEDPACEEFFAYTRDGVESVAYGLKKGHPVLYAGIQRFDRGRLMECDVMDVKPPSEFDERYLYEGGRLVEVQAVARGGEADGNRGRWDVQYDRQGRYRCLRRFDDAYDLFFVIHWNPATAPKVEELGAEIRRKLIDLIPKVVKKAKIRQRAFSVALAYDFENDPLPPYLGVGLVSEREQWLATRGREAKAFLWNPAEYERYEDGTLNLDDEELDEASAMFCQLLLAKFDTWSAQKVLNGVALELNRRDWSKVLPVSDDFIVYAVDLEGGHLKPNLKAGVPAKKLQLLRKRRLI